MQQHFYKHHNTCKTRNVFEFIVDYIYKHIICVEIHYKRPHNTHPFDIQVFSTPVQKAWRKKSDKEEINFLVDILFHYLRDSNQWVVKHDKYNCTSKHGNQDSCFEYTYLEMKLGHCAFVTFAAAVYISACLLRDVKVIYGSMRLSHSINFNICL